MEIILKRILFALAISIIIYVVVGNIFSTTHFMFYMPGQQPVEVTESTYYNDLGADPGFCKIQYLFNGRVAITYGLLTFSGLILVLILHDFLSKRTKKEKQPRKKDIKGEENDNNDEEAIESLNKMITEVKKMTDRDFPKGEKDIGAGAKELLNILENKIDHDFAKLIFVKSVAISRISDVFDKVTLKDHLSNYCLHYFNESQVDQFYKYLFSLSSAMYVDQRPPSEVRRVNDDYVW